MCKMVSPYNFALGLFTKAQPSKTSGHLIHTKFTVQVTGVVYLLQKVLLENSIDSAHILSRSSALKYVNFLKL